MKNPINDEIFDKLNTLLNRIESHTQSDCIFMHTDIGFGLARFIDKLILDLQEKHNDYHDNGRLVCILTTSGGSGEECSRIVNVIRNYYKEVIFIVPDYAFSAGTILCMSGDEIYMDYFSVLGPIDPQVQNKDNSNLIPAQGYLDKVAEFVRKSKEGTLSDVEYMMLKDIDLADLRFYEQSRELSIDLLKVWLVKYKFKNWTKHASTGEIVTYEDKIERAQWIASQLSDNNIWKTHSRGISINTLRDLKLIIKDYSEDAILWQLVRDHYELVSDYIFRNKMSGFFHTRRFI